MNFKIFLKDFFIHTCVYTTVAFAAAMLFVLAGGVTSFATVTYFLILAFCGFLALANVIFAKATFSVWWRSLIHVVLTLGGFFLCIYWRFADIGTPSESLTLFVVLATLAYALIFGTFLTVRYLLARKKEKKEYEQTIQKANQNQKRR